MARRAGLRDTAPLSPDTRDLSPSAFLERMPTLERRPQGRSAGGMGIDTRRAPASSRDRDSRDRRPRLPPAVRARMLAPCPHSPQARDQAAGRRPRLDRWARPSRSWTSATRWGKPDVAPIADLNRTGIRRRVNAALRPPRSRSLIVAASSPAGAVAMLPRLISKLRAADMLGLGHAAERADVGRGEPERLALPGGQQGVQGPQTGAGVRRGTRDLTLARFANTSHRKPHAAFM